MSNYKPDLRNVHLEPSVTNYQWPTPALVEETLKICQPYAKLIHNGVLSIQNLESANFGRQPKDRFILVDEVTSALDDGVDWSDKGNQSISRDNFEKIYKHVQESIKGETVYVQDLFAAGNTEYRESVRFIGTEPWQCNFLRNMLYIPNTDELGDNFHPDLTVISIPGKTFPQWAVDECGLNSGDFILLDLTRNLILVGGSYYGGELKKAIFTKLNFTLLKRGVLPMHASANVDNNGHVSIMFGLSGTGKTTLSMAINRALLGDDEIGWSDEGTFNIEGGCYAKTIDLDPNKEPLIYAATERANSILENGAFDPDSRYINYYDTSITENGRCSFGMEAIPGAVLSGVAGKPTSIIFLTYDAFGVLPPISKLSLEQAGLFYALGYTSKVAGTEKGIKEPIPSFSPVFGGPFYIGYIKHYVDMLMSKIKASDIPVYLVNTGLSGGAYGIGERMDINVSRALVAAAQDGVLAGVEYVSDPVFGFDVPAACPGVDSEILNPKSTWLDEGAYDVARRTLGQKFIDRANEMDLPEYVIKSVPVVK